MNKLRTIGYYAGLFLAGGVTGGLILDGTIKLAIILTIGVGLLIFTSNIRRDGGS